MRHHYIVWFGASKLEVDAVSEVIKNHVDRFQQYAPHEIIDGETPTWPSMGAVFPPGVPGSNAQRKLARDRHYVCVKAYVISEIDSVAKLDDYIHSVISPAKIWLIEKSCDLELISKLLERK